MDVVTDSEMVAAIREHREILQMVGHKPTPRDSRAAIAHLQNERTKAAMIAAGWRKVPPEVFNLAQRILEFAFHGDYSNGNDAFGIDEGRVRAREALDSFDAELKEVKRRYVLAQEEK